MLRRFPEHVFLAAAALCAVLALGGCGNPEAKAAYEAAAAALTEGDTATAEAGFRALIEEGEFVSESWRGIGIIQLGEDDPADACISFEKALLFADQQDPEYFTDTEMYLADARARHGEADKALVVYDKILAEQYDPEIAFLRGSLLLAQGEAEKAAEDFESIAEKNVNSDLMIAVCDLYRSLGYMAEGDAVLERIIAAGGEAAPARRGLALYCLEEYPEAEEALRDALAADPEDADSLMLLGQTLLAQEETEEARSLFEQYAAGGSAAALNGLALCDMADGLYEEALSKIEKGLTSGDESARQGLAYNEITALEYLGRWDEAKAKVKAYMEAYPDDEAGIKENAFLAGR